MRMIQKYWKYIAIMSLILMIIYFSIGVFLFSYVSFTHLTESYLVSSSMDLLGMMICLLMYYCTLSDIKHPNYETMYFQALLHEELAYIFFDELTWMLNGNVKYMLAIQFTNFISYIIPIALLILFWGYVQTSLDISLRKNLKHSSILVSVASIDFILICLNFKYHFYYRITSNGIYERGDYFFISTIFFVGLLALIAIFTFLEKVDADKRRKIVAYISLPLIFTLVMNFSFGYSFFVEAVLCTIFLIFINIYKQRGVELALKNEEISRKNQELTQAQTAMMISQIQPHFLYNTLSSISMLYDIDPDKSKEAINRFSSYLRANLDSIANKQPISMKKEMEHVNNYLFLEQMRFDDLLIHISIESDDFNIPALTIQPLVENAIKHGIMGKEDGGELWIKEIEHDSYHEIIVKDDGIGFDVNQEPKQDGRSHVGMANVRDRLANMVNGTLEIKSVEGIGTLVKISIPKQVIGNENK